MTRYPVVSDKPHVFVVGVARSGTTLLRLMLGGHPALFSPPEMVLAPFATMAERRALLHTRFWEKGGLRRTFIELEDLDVAAAKERVNGLDQASVPDVYRLLESLIGDRRLVDKCPHLCHYPDALDRVAAWFPGARFLWIVRNPGSVIRSFNSVNMAEVLLAGSERESIRTATHKLIRTPPTADRTTLLPVDELYDVGSDPGETAQLHAARPIVAGELRAKLDREVAGLERPPPPPQAEIDAALEEALRQLGYIED